MRRDYSFKPGWAASLAVALLVPVFLSLGQWQLRRAAEREALQTLRDAHLNEPPFPLAANARTLDQIRYRHVTVTGTYDAAHQFLLDNQIHAGQAGFQVLTPLKLAGHPPVAVIVNRGWVAAGPDRNHLPAVELSATPTVTVEGLVEKFPEVAWRLPGAETPAPGWPALTLIAEPAALSARLGYSLLPYQVLLSPLEPLGFVRDWQPAAVDPARNRGYALQWFAFAAVLSGLYAWHGWRVTRTPPARSSAR